MKWFKSREEKDFDKKIENEKDINRRFREEVKYYKDQLVNEQSKFSRDLIDLKHKHDIEVSKLQNVHTLALKEKEFELKHSKDVEIKKMEQIVVEAERKMAVLEAENKMLDEFTDYGKDIIDIKEVMNKLIGKLPTVNLSGGLALSAPVSKEK